ncbi:MAG: DUF1080 domain-containing protein [Planctomycetia bacterium]|nr:DUF1080 domain-containing protein [Planctomycetia bacterium]
MKRRMRTIWLLCVAGAGLSGALDPVMAFQKPEAKASDQSKPPEGFESIFNGRDLTGWEGGAQYWKVQDGCLTGTADGTLKYNRFIVWRGGQVENFELRVQVKVSPGGNSGLQYRSTERPDLGESVVAGYQCDVVAGRADYDGMLYEERGRRILAHTGERVIIDPQGQPWVVGEFKLRAFNKLKGVLGMQVHVGPPMTIQYRNIHLKKLPADLPVLTAKEAPVPADARKVVPQGQDKP